MSIIKNIITSVIVFLLATGQAGMVFAQEKLQEANFTETGALSVRQQETEKLAEEPHVTTDGSEMAVQEKSGPVRHDSEPTVRSANGNPNTPPPPVQVFEDSVHTSVNEHRGSLEYVFDIVVPAGRRGTEPNISISYNSQQTNNQSILGYGWEHNIPSIKRINRYGIEDLYTENVFYSSLDGELVHVNGNTYRPEIEHGNFMQYDFDDVAGVWTITDKKGTVYTFGASGDERKDDPNDQARIAEWMISRTQDTLGNFVAYEYTKDQGQIYPASITYTGFGADQGDFEIIFTLESRSDVTTQYGTGFAVTTDKRISEITVTESGDWVRKYTFDYTAGVNGVRSLLSAITESGKNSSGSITALPATEFSYQTHDVTWASSQNANWDSPADFRKGVLIGDVNGDGLDDVLQHYQIYNNPDPAIFITGAWLNNGNGWSYDENFIPPHPVSRSDPNGDSNAVIHNGVRLIDKDGDGLPDIVGAGGNYKNTGSGWVSFSGVSGEHNVCPLAAGSQTITPYPDRGHRITDVNGDGVLDHAHVWNNPFGGSGLVDTHIYTYEQNNTCLQDDDYNGESPFDFTQRTFFIDINADNLPDILHGNQNYDYPYDTVKETYINTGNKSWVLDSNWESPIRFGYKDANGNEYNDHVRIIDGNFDGLPDILSVENGASSYANTGNGWVAGGETSNWLAIGSGTVYPYPDRAFRLMHVNDDGVLDVVQAWVNPFGGSGIIETNAYLSSGTITKSDILSRITEPTGAVTDIDYETTTVFRDINGDSLNPDIRSQHYVVKSVTIDDGEGNIITDDYIYTGGSYYFDNLYKRKFSGFSTTTLTNSQGNTTTTYYHQGNETNTTLGEHNDSYHKIGKPYRTEVANQQGEILQTTITTWDETNLGNGAAFVYKTAESVRNPYDATTTTYTYDTTNGNLLQETDYGETDVSNNGNFTDTGDDGRYTKYTYAGDTSFVARKTVKTLDDIPEQKTKYYYDNLPFEQVSNGLLTRRSVFTGETASQVANTDYQYNTMGLQTAMIDHYGNTTTYEYTDPYHILPNTTTNTLGHTTHHQYNYSSGQPTHITHPNGFEEIHSYDGLDRLIQTQQEISPNTFVTTQTIDYNDTQYPNYIHTTNHLDQNTTTEERTYLDGFGRTIQTKKKDENNNWITTDTIYNNVGNIHKQSLPYHTTTINYTSPTTASHLYTTSTYDALHRPVQVTTVMGDTTYLYEGLSTTVTDVMGNKKELHYDGHGNIITVVEHNDSDTYTTSYRYNTQDNLVRITDAEGNIRNFTYDWRGLRTYAEDLHDPNDETFGVYTFAYDRNNNLVKKTTPNSDVIKYKYDEANRVVKELSNSTPYTDIKYIYDSCTNGTGKICSIITPYHTEDYQYDLAGNQTLITKTIDDIYHTQTSYDRQGNPTQITYPDSTIVAYMYDNAGRPERVMVDGIAVATVTYAPHGSVDSITYDNGITTIYTYDDEELYRLQNKTSTTSLGEELQNYTYTYDTIGNIIQLRDMSIVETAKSARYTYDDLYRLINARVSVTTGDSYDHTFKYSPTGNIVVGPGGSYTYNSTTATNTNPHAVTNINNTTFTYDNNGNVLTDNQGTYTYDYRNKQTTATTGNTTTTYTYDHNGQRLSKINATTETHFVDDTYTVEDTIPSIDLSLAGTNIAIYTPNQGIQAILTDHLGGTAVVYGNQVDEVIDYYPFGSLRIDTNQNQQSKKYTGHEYDSETDLVYMKARYYGGGVGRFYSQDPVHIQLGSHDFEQNFPSIDRFLKDPQQLNSYSYVRNSPNTFVDDEGEWVKQVAGGTVSAIFSFYENYVEDIKTNITDPNVSGIGIIAIRNETPYHRDMGLAFVEGAAYATGLVYGAVATYLEHNIVSYQETGEYDSHGSIVEIMTKVAMTKIAPSLKVNISPSVVGHFISETFDETLGTFVADFMRPIKEEVNKELHNSANEDE